jgi:hypothetical protein
VKKSAGKKQRKRKGDKAQEGEDAGSQLDPRGELKLAVSLAVAQGQTRLVAEFQKLIGTLLRRIIASLPPSPEELDPEVDLEGAADGRSELRRVLQCVLRDYVEPAYGDLLAGAEYQPSGEGYFLLDLVLDELEKSGSERPIRSASQKPIRRARS